MRIIAICGPFGAPLDQFVEEISSQEQFALPMQQKNLVILSEKDYGTDTYAPDHASLCAAIDATPAAVVIVTGHFLFTNAILRDLFNLKIFLECSGDTCLVQDLKAKQGDSTATMLDKLQDYEKHMKPNNAKINLSIDFADMVVTDGMSSAGMQKILAANIEMNLRSASSPAAVIEDDQAIATQLTDSEGTANRPASK